MTVAVDPALCCAPLAAPTLSDHEAIATAELFKALGDPSRVRIVNALATSAGEPVCICNLTEPLGLTQPTVSHHMRKLVDAEKQALAKKATRSQAIKAAQAEAPARAA